MQREGDGTNLVGEIAVVAARIRYHVRVLLDGTELVVVIARVLGPSSAHPDSMLFVFLGGIIRHP